MNDTQLRKLISENEDLVIDTLSSIGADDIAAHIDDYLALGHLIAKAIKKAFEDNQEDLVFDADPYAVSAEHRRELRSLNDVTNYFRQAM